MIRVADNDRVRLMEMATRFAIGGTERQLVELANGLDADRFDVQLSCLHRWGSFLSELKSKRPPDEFRIHHLYGLPALRQQLRLAAHLWKNRIQIFHAQGFYPNVFGIPAARLARTPVAIASIRDLGDNRTLLQRLAQRVACALADAIVVNADVVRRQLVGEGWPDKKIHVIHNGVDLTRYAAAPKRPELRRELGLPAEGPVVAVVSRLNPQKGIEQFIDAAALIGARFPQAHFLVVGDQHKIPGASNSGYRATLEERALRLGLGKRLVFAGFRLDVPQILAQVSVAVLPSLTEALSNSLLESMAAGAPVVATEVGGNPEVVEDGVTGLLVPPQDPEALARAVCRLLEWPQEAERLGRAGRRLIHERFSVAQMVHATEQLYLGLLAQAPRGKRVQRRLKSDDAIPTQPAAS